MSEQLDPWDVHGRLVRLEQSNRDVYHRRLGYHTNAVLILYGVVAAGFWRNMDSQAPTVFALLAAVSMTTAAFATLSPVMLRRVYCRVLEFTLAREMLEQHFGLRSSARSETVEECDECPGIRDFNPRKLNLPPTARPWVGPIFPSPPFSIRVKAPSRRHAPRVAAAVFIALPLLAVAALSPEAGQVRPAELRLGSLYGLAACTALLIPACAIAAAWDRYPEVLQALSMIAAVLAALGDRLPPRLDLSPGIMIGASTVLFGVSSLIVWLSTLRTPRSAMVRWHRALSKHTIAGHWRKLRNESVSEGGIPRRATERRRSGQEAASRSLIADSLRATRNTLSARWGHFKKAAGDSVRRETTDRTVVWSLVGLGLVSGVTAIAAALLGRRPEVWLSADLAQYTNEWGLIVFGALVGFVWAVPNAVDRTVRSLVDLPEDLFEWLSPNIRSRHRYHLWMTGVMRLLGLGGFVAAGVLVIMAATAP